MSDKTFVCVTFIKTTPERLWEALTNADFIEKYWFGSKFETDWKVGSAIKENRDTGEPGFHGEILEAEPPRRLSYTFIGPDKIETSVIFTIEVHEDTVSLTTTHKGYERGSNTYKSVSIGWSAIHSALKTLLETGEPLNKKSIYDLFARLQN